MQKKYNADIFAVCSDSDFYDKQDDCYYFLNDLNNNITKLYGELSGCGEIQSWRIYKNYKFIDSNLNKEKIINNLSILGKYLKDVKIIDNTSE